MQIHLFFLSEFQSEEAMNLWMSEPCTIGILVDEADRLAKHFLSSLPTRKVRLSICHLFSSLNSLLFNIFCPIIHINLLSYLHWKYWNKDSTWPSRYEHFPFLLILLMRGPFILNWRNNDKLIFSNFSCKFLNPNKLWETSRNKLKKHSVTRNCSDLSLFE